MAPGGSNEGRATKARRLCEETSTLSITEREALPRRGNCHRLSPDHAHSEMCARADLRGRTLEVVSLRVRFRSSVTETFLELKGALSVSLVFNGLVVDRDAAEGDLGALRALAARPPGRTTSTTANSDH